ncbi:hypothetical protein C8T65DRAFT_827095 [Cerioporus squamosus]|nr:hypothetical protein C8T65DRAFT_827095 [Cerioporus squamosus]
MSSPPPATPVQVLASFTKKAPDPEVPNIVLIYHPARDKMFLQIPVRRCPLPGGLLSDTTCIPRTALLDACEVLTRKKGELALDRQGQQLVMSDLIAGGRGYYYIVESDYEHDYPIFHTFYEWVPPPRKDVPDRWFTKVYPRIRPAEFLPCAPWHEVKGDPESTIGAEVKNMDKKCMMSAYRAPLEAAHVVPAAHNAWYHARKVVSQLCFPAPLPTHLRESSRIHDVRNLITLRADIRRRWDDLAFMYIPVDGEFIAYYISGAPEEQACDFHCARLVTPDRSDGYLLYLRFALAIFNKLVGGGESIDAHPESSRITKGLPSRASKPPSLPLTAEESDAPEPRQGREPGEGGLPTRDGRTDLADAAEMEEVAQAALMDDASVARMIIGCYEDGDEELPADLAAVWDKYIDKPDVKRLRDEWEQQQKRLRESGPSTSFDACCSSIDNEDDSVRSIP